MPTIRINPDRLSKNVKNIEKQLKEYKSNYKKLLSIIENNDAKLDDTTLAALKVSCNAMNAKFKEMTDFLDMALDVTKEVIKEFNDANNKAEKMFSS